MKNIKLNYNPSTFCSPPFTHLELHHDGHVSPCCKALIDADKKLNGCENQMQIWNSDWLKKMRAQLFNGTKPEECRVCFESEKIGATSLRQRSLEDSSLHMN